MKFTPRKYQKKGVKKCMKKFGGRALLADDMGLGKSLQAIMMTQKVPEERVLIACPSPLKYNWVAEFAKFAPGEKLFICSGQKPSQPPKSFRVIICNYEILQHWRDSIIEAGVNMMICDEGHYLKNRTALRTKAALRIAKTCKYRIVMTGTPIENKPAELFTQLQIIDPKLFPSWLLFIKRYNGARRDQWGWKLSKATNIQELHDKLTDNCMVRRTKEEVLTELPEKIRQVVPLEIANRKEYDEAESDIIKWLRKNTQLNIDKAKKAQQMVKLDKLKYLSAKGKVDQFASWVNCESPNEKLVVFCYHKDMVAELHKKLDNCLLVDGSTTGKDRQALVNEFQTNPKKRVFLTTIRIGGTGFTLTESSTTVFFQQDWNASKHNQAEDRVHRMGQKSSRVRAMYFIAQNTVEEKIVKLIDAKRQDASRIIDGKAVEENELLVELMKELTQ